MTDATDSSLTQALQGLSGLGPKPSYEKPSCQSSPSAKKEDKGEAGQRAPLELYKKPPTTGAGVWSLDQQRVLDVDVPRLVLHGLAGTGKSRVLAELMRRRSRLRWVYVTHSAALADHARTWLPSQVRVMTWHAWAFRHTGHAVAERLIDEAAWPEAVRRWMELGNTSRDRLYCQALCEGLLTFIRSADGELRWTPTLWLRLAPWASVQERYPVERALEDAWCLWEAMGRQNSTCPVIHDAYVKRAFLGGFDLPSEGLVWDEYQDGTACWRAWWEAQRPACAIRAGDAYQDIQWTREPLGEWHDSEAFSTTLTTSWRQGPQLAARSTACLRALGCPVALEGRGDQEDVWAWESKEKGDPSFLKIEEPFTALVRTKAGALATVAALLERGKTVAPLAFTLPWNMTHDIQAAQAGEAGKLRHDGLREWVRTAGRLRKEHLDKMGGGEYAGQLATSWTLAHLSPEAQARLRTWEKAGASPEAACQVMTIHASKGKTLRRVVLGLEDTWVPDTYLDRDRSESKRLLYVAVSRASTHITVESDWWRAWEPLLEAETHDVRDAGF